MVDLGPEFVAPTVRHWRARQGPGEDGGQSVVRKSKCIPEEESPTRAELETTFPVIPLALGSVGVSDPRIRRNTEHYGPLENAQD